MDENKRLLEVREIDSGYGEMQILFQLNMELNRDEIVCIIGPNGAGKSTLMKSVFGLLKPWSGKIVFLQEDITGLSPNEIVRRGMCYVPQTENVFPTLTVKENLEMGAFIRDDDISGRIQDIFNMFPDLREKKNQRAGKLSGGQQQMVAMGRALMLDPKILLLDEPTAGLSPKLATEILRQVITIKESGVAILMVEQNAKKALEMSDRGYVLAMGRNKYQDTGENLLANKEIKQLYLGG